MQTDIEDIAVYTQGNRDKQPIVFIHGFPFDHTLWDEVIEDLKEDFYCIAYDIRGFGNSRVGNGQYTMESYVDDLETIITKLELQNVIVCGFSMGGYIALRASQRMQNFKALILANTTATSDDDKAKLKRAAAIKDITQNGVQPFLDTFFNAAFTKEFVKQNPQKVQEMQKRILSFDPVGIKGGLLAMLSRTDTTQSLEKAPPTLLITADKDEVIPAKAVKETASKIPKATVVKLANAAHVSMIEKPKEFIQTIKRLKKLI